MLDAYDLIPILWHTPVQVGHVHPPCTMFSHPVHAGRMDQSTIYDMGVMYIGPHGSHTTWAKRSYLR